MIDKPGRNQPKAQNTHTSTIRRVTLRPRPSDPDPPTLRPSDPPMPSKSQMPLLTNPSMPHYACMESMNFTAYHSGPVFA